MPAGVTIFPGDLIRDLCRHIERAATSRKVCPPQPTVPDIIGAIAKLRTPEKMRLHRLGHGNDGGQENVNLPARQSGGQTMLRLAAHGLVLQSRRYTCQQRTENTYFSLAVLHDRTQRFPDFIVLDVHLRHWETNAVKSAEKLHEILSKWQRRYPSAQARVDAQPSVICTCSAPTLSPRTLSFGPKPNTPGPVTTSTTAQYLLKL